MDLLKPNFARVRLEKFNKPSEQWLDIEIKKIQDFSPTSCEDFDSRLVLQVDHDGELKRCTVSKLARKYTLECHIVIFDQFDSLKTTVTNGFLDCLCKQMNTKQNKICNHELNKDILF